MIKNKGKVWDILTTIILADSEEEIKEYFGYALDLWKKIKPEFDKTEG